MRKCTERALREREEREREERQCERVEEEEARAKLKGGRTGRELIEKDQNLDRN
jgi:hypothetical protein